MTNGPTKIASKDSCIYCGRTNVALTDEHIVPLSLGGVHVISKASCKDCNDITKRFEQDIARGLWGDARISYDAPSRRKRLRKTHTDLPDPDRPGSTYRFPYSDYPAAMVFYKMQRAGLLQGLSPFFDVEKQWELIAVVDEERANDFERRHSKKLTAKFRHVPHSFGRLLAKIGYGQVLCSLDPGDFRPICLPYILGHKSNISYVVGGSPIIPPKSSHGYILRTISFGNRERLMIMAEVRLYANNHTPVYHVVVGDVAGEKSIELALQKLGDGQFDSYSYERATNNLEEYHWMPRTWPLPFWTASSGS